MRVAQDCQCPSWTNRSVSASIFRCVEWHKLLAAVCVEAQLYADCCVRLSIDGVGNVPGCRMEHWHLLAVVVAESTTHARYS
jgi:hypothetical protein